MTILRRALHTFLSAVSGAVVGFVLGVYGPFVIAMMRGKDPIHSGHFGQWIEVLIVVGPILGGGALAALTWFGRFRALRITVHSLALVAIGWQVYLMIG